VIETMVVSVVDNVTIRSQSTWRRYVAICLIIPFSIGAGVSIIHLDKITTIMEPFITKFMSYTNQHRTLLSFGSNNSNSSATTTMNVEKCFIDLERKMFETVPNWNEIDHKMIVIHRNGQAEPCANTSSVIATTSLATATNKAQTDTTSYLPVASAFYNVLEDLQLLGQPCPDFKNKYHVEAFLTRVFVKLLPAASCFSEDDVGKKQKLMELGLFDYCDMGEDKTPILLDHNKLIANTIRGTDNRHFSMLPCHFHTEHGVRVTSLHQFATILQSKAAQASGSDNPSNSCIIAPNGESACSDNAITTDISAADSSLSFVPSPNELHLYAVPAGRVFMHVAAYVGQIIDLSHVPGADPNKPVYLEVLSVSPAVFDLHNFFTKDESAELVQRALAETKESHRIKRSTTGTGEHHVNNRRTSESGFDTDGATAITIKKYVCTHSYTLCLTVFLPVVSQNHVLIVSLNLNFRRCFQVLGFDEYIESHGDGLQILRYNQTTAYSKFPLNSLRTICILGR
jgi:hypothetical protein